MEPLFLIFVIIYFAHWAYKLGKSCGSRKGYGAARSKYEQKQ